eukprot:TRINITY_DN2352_c0_g1_i7.p1 TRINITY_DN2352_c0_g1~~TRINITY_DN2352_c0_g1_i7.p1  ORF type:complete len:111 (+),score=16.09 TRINITY_DN2352_c0_g1_i7:236-568(+)
MIAANSAMGRGDLTDLSVSEYRRTPANAAGRKLPHINQSFTKDKVSEDKSKALAQRAMLKYNLSSEEVAKYQEFIKLLATFDQRKVTLTVDNADLFAQQALKAAKELGNV